MQLQCVHLFCHCVSRAKEKWKFSSSLWNFQYIHLSPCYTSLSRLGHDLKTRFMIIRRMFFDSRRMTTPSCLTEVTSRRWILRFKNPNTSDQKSQGAQSDNYFSHVMYLICASFRNYCMTLAVWDGAEFCKVVKNTSPLWFLSPPRWNAFTASCGFSAQVFACNWRLCSWRRCNEQQAKKDKVDLLFIQKVLKVDNLLSIQFKLASTFF